MKKITDTSEMLVSEIHKALNSRALNVAQAHVDLRLVRGDEEASHRAKAWVEYCEKDMSELAASLADRMENNTAQAKLKAWPAPRYNYAATCQRLFNGFGRSIACPKLVFKTVCNDRKIAEIRLNDALMGTLIEHGPDKFLFIDHEGSEFGYETLNMTKSIFVDMVCESHCISRAWNDMQFRFEEVGF